MWHPVNNSAFNEDVELIWRTKFTEALDNVGFGQYWVGLHFGTKKAIKYRYFSKIYRHNHSFFEPKRSPNSGAIFWVAVDCFVIFPIHPPPPDYSYPPPLGISLLHCGFLEPRKWHCFRVSPSPAIWLPNWRLVLGCYGLELGIYFGSNKSEFPLRIILFNFIFIWNIEHELIFRGIFSIFQIKE